ncbi:hypothetical protein HDU96_009834 [Phlyctochytrium bullatum]|nr:hypothetical protein HDU96_009834 [Phlyctochytrium bullatum]
MRIDARRLTEDAVKAQILPLVRHHESLTPFPDPVSNSPARGGGSPPSSSAPSRSPSPSPRRRQASRSRSRSRSPPRPRFVTTPAGRVTQSTGSLDLESEMEAAEDEERRRRRRRQRGRRSGDDGGMWNHVVDVDWTPVYVAECSLEGNNLFGKDDPLVVVVTDGFLYVADPRKKTGSVPALVRKIRLLDVVEVEQCAINLGFEYAFPHVFVHHQEMVRVRPPGKLISSERFSLEHRLFAPVGSGLGDPDVAKVLEAASGASERRDQRIDYTLLASGYVDTSDVRPYEALEAKYLRLGRLATVLKITAGKLSDAGELGSSTMLMRDDGVVNEGFVMDVVERIRVLGRMMELAEWNKAIKRVFWKSMACYKHLFDETESCLLIMQVYLASLVGEAMSVTSATAPVLPRRASDAKRMLLASPNVRGMGMKEGGRLPLLGIEEDETCFKLVAR